MIEPIRHAVTVRLPPPRAFDAFARDIGRWWPRGKTIGAAPHAEIVIEPRAGGRWYERADDGAETDWGRVIAWEPPGRLLLGWQIDAGFRHDPELTTEVEVSFAPDGEGTRVTLEHRCLERFGDAASRVREQLDNGWPGMLRCLRDHADAGSGGGAASVPFVVHGVPGSPYVRAALLGLEEKSATWRLRPLEMGEHRRPEFRAWHPFARMPVVDHGDFRLYETQAILRYADRVLPGACLIPADAREEARMNQICGVTDCYVHHRISAPITFPRRVAPVFGLPVDEAAVAAAVPQAEACLAEVARLVGEGPYAACGKLTIADLMLIPHLDYFADTPEGAAMLRPHAALLDWIARMRARPSMANTSWERLTEVAQAA